MTMGHQAITMGGSQIGAGFHVEVQGTVEVMATPVVGAVAGTLMVRKMSLSEVAGVVREVAVAGHGPREALGAIG